MISYHLPGYKNRTVTPRYTVVHHTAGTDSLRICLYGRSDLPGPLCHYLISKDGTVHHITDGYANHVGEALPGFSNYNCIGIELENRGDGADPYPEVQLQSARALCRELGLPVYGHKEICSQPGRKIDPSFDMDAFRASLTEDDMTPQELLNTQIYNDGPLGAVLSWTLQRTTGVADAVIALNKKVDALTAEVAALKNASNQSGGTWEGDPDLFAEAVADKLADRLAN